VRGITFHMVYNCIYALKKDEPSTKAKSLKYEKRPFYLHQPNIKSYITKTLECTNMCDNTQV
jgi:hypothetical protein